MKYYPKSSCTAFLLLRDIKVYEQNAFITPTLGMNNYLLRIHVIIVKVCYQIKQRTIEELKNLKLYKTILSKCDTLRFNRSL